MFEYLKGRIEYKKADYVALDINGIGYKINISLRTHDKIKVHEEIRFYIYNYIKEDTYKLIGFLTERERKAFELLLEVKGVGVSLALGIMSTFDVDTLISLINSKDYKNLKRVPKLGEKKSKQVILDLGEKVQKLGLESFGNNEIVASIAIQDELYEALQALGYSKKEIDKLITKEELLSFKSIEDAIKTVLKKLN